MKVLLFLATIFSYQMLSANTIETRVITAHKFIGAVEEISVFSRGVRYVEVIGIESDTNVQEVEVQTSRNRYKVYELEREVSRGETIKARLDPREFVETIRISATPDWTGSRGKFKVVVYLNDNYDRRDRYDRRDPRDRRYDRRHPRSPRHPRIPEHNPRGPYSQYEKEVIYDLLYDFAKDSFGGLGLFSFDARDLADSWVRRGRICGSEHLVRQLIERFERAYDHHYRKPGVFSKEARQRALRDIRPMSPCTNLLYVD